MYSQGLFFTLSLPWLALADVAAQIDDGGVTQIYGNSFGVPGIDVAYDYVIVGGGTAGNTIAARLAQDPANYTVAVIEAGSFYEILNGNRSQVPGYSYQSSLASSETSRSMTQWQGQRTVPQAGYNGRQLDYTVGQAFGGGSSANYMGYMRPSAGSLDQWAEIVGDPAWSWENVYPFFKLSCNFTPPNYEKIDRSLNITYDEDAFIPNAGPLQLSYGNYQYPYGGAISRGLERLGFRSLAGANSGDIIGFSSSTATIDPNTATRSSSETSFLQSAARDTSIKLYPNTIAKRILFDDDNRATGVLVQATSLHNFTWTISANNEVIVSSGVWRSPQILMVSGIGPSTTLQENGISVIADVPGVGQNEWDQPWMALSYKINSLTGTQIQVGNIAYNDDVVQQYLRNQSGPLSTIGGGEVIGFEKFPNVLHESFSNSTRAFLNTFPSDWPNLEYLPLAYAATPEIVSTTDNYLLIGSALFSTSSRGNMTISSADSLDPPIISPNWLLDRGDQEQAVAALLRIRDVANASGIVESEFQPGTNVSTRAEILDWLQENMTLIYHGSSTCKMGRANDTTAVVDSHARVRGVSNLRVVDASAFPILPPGQPQSVVYMFAERIAEFILDGE